MPKVPPSLAHLGPSFSVAGARSAGVSPDALRRADLRVPFHGLRATGDAPTDAELVARCRELLPRLKPWQFYSHETALGLAGVPLPAWPHRPRLHVAAHRPAREPRTAGIVGHRLQVRESAVILIDGLPVEHPVRAWRQAATTWRLDDLIAAAEHLVSSPEGFATIEDLRSEIETMGDVRRGTLRRALAEVRAGSRSPREVALRLLLSRSGLPEPEISYALTVDGRFVAELDLAYPRWRVGVEYDGRVHADDAAQFERDADRWERIRRSGWTNVRILRHHLRGDGRVALERVRYALMEAGWRPNK